MFGSQSPLTQPAQTQDPETPESLCSLKAGVAFCGDGHGARCSRSHCLRFGDESNGPFAIESHDLLDPVPVGFG